MITKNVIRVSEFEKLYYDNTKPFKQKHWEALCHYLDDVNKKEEKQVEYYRILNKGIQFTNYVGVIQAGDLTIEVLPKIDKRSSTAANENTEKLEATVFKEKQKWHNVLLQMLKECKLLKVNHVDYANLNLRSNSILDIYIELFLIEAQRLLHEGLLKQYLKNEGNQTALKGQLAFSKQIAYNNTHQERFYVRYTEYSYNNVYNQILFKTIQFVPKISISNYLLDKVGRLILDFPQVSNCKVTAETFDQIQFNRKTERYKEALLICKMLLLNYRPDITGGTENIIAILFDMNKLWEEFVYRRLKKEETSFDVKIQRQQSASFWITPKLSKPKTIRPDIVLIDNNETIVIDTKWKLIEQLTPSDEDLKQMFIYNLFWGCKRSILLYPSEQQAYNYGDYFDHNKKEKYSSRCGAQTVSVFDSDDKLDRNFGSSLLKTIIAIPQE